MTSITPELIRQEALASRGAELDDQRCAELAADVGKLNEATHALRERLDFNDEPARFAALLGASAQGGAGR